MDDSIGESEKLSGDPVVVGRWWHVIPVIFFIALGAILYIWFRADFYSSPEKRFNTLGILATLMATAATFVEVVRSASKYDLIRKVFDIGEFRRRSSNMTRLTHEINTALQLLQNGGPVGVVTLSGISGLFYETFSGGEVVDEAGKTLSEFLTSVKRNVSSGEYDVRLMCDDLLALNDFLRIHDSKIGRAIGLAAAGGRT